MRLGLHLTRFNWPEGDAAIGSRVVELVKRAEDAGFDGFWPMDHLYQIGLNGPPEEPMLEGYTLLAFAAGFTTRIKLGLLVTGVTYRHPGMLVKTVSTLDVLSGGRAYLGIGAAWNEREHRGLGVPFPPLAERFERLEETLQIFHQMWNGGVEPFTGRHYQLAETLCRPLPLQQPHPPIMVGGGGERKTLRLVAKYADACNIFDGPEVAHKLDVLKAHCQDVGRPYEEITKTVSVRIAVSRDGGHNTHSPAETIDHLGRLAGLGFGQAIVMLPEPLSASVVDLFGERIVPEAAKLATAGRASSGRH
jgi:F420-dependent oxidoreductase-like protein